MSDMGKIIKFGFVWILMMASGFADEVKTKPYVLEDIYRFKFTETSDISSLLMEIDDRTSFSSKYFKDLDILLSRPSIEISVSEQNVSVESFENAVNEVMSRCGVEDMRSLADQISTSCKRYLKYSDETENCEVLEQGIKLVKSLFENPTICGYLAREEYQLNSKSYMVFSKIEEDIYFLMKNVENHRKDFLSINYRCAEKSLHNNDLEDYNQSELFYESGTNNLISQKLVVNTARIKKEKLQNEPNIFYGPGGDIYDVAIKLKNIEDGSKVYAFSNKTDYAYFIMPGAKDMHAYFTTAIVDVKTKKVLAVFLINSSENEDYRYYLGYRLNLDRNRFREKDKDIPFVEASLDLQKEEGDLNCAFYTVAFSHAMIDLLSDHRNELDQLVELADYNEVSKWMSSRLPEYLPQYYNKDENGGYAEKSPEEIKAHHMRLRWNLSVEDVKAIIVGD